MTEKQDKTYIHTLCRERVNVVFTEVGGEMEGRGSLYIYISNRYTVVTTRMFFALRWAAM